MLRTILRIAGRDFRRRPAQTLLVIGGLLVSSLVMSAALVAGDSMEELFLANTYAAWGPVDVAVGSVSGRPFPSGLADPITSHPGVRASSIAVSERLALRATVENLSSKRREPSVQIIGLSSGDRKLGSFEMVSGDQLMRDGKAVINQRLAERIDAAIGDELSILARGVDGAPLPLAFTVGGIAKDTGKADNGRAPNVFTDLAELQTRSGYGQIVNVVVMSAAGRIRDEAGSAKLEKATSKALDQVAPSTSGAPELIVAGSKADDVKGSREQSKFFRAILTMLGTVVALASIALIVNLFVMLGEERRAESGTLRALGLKRSGLVLLGLSEGVLYSIAAAIIGSGLGAFFGRYLADLMGDLFASFSVNRSFEFARPGLEVRVRSLIQAGLGGFIVTISSVAFVSIRTSRLTVIAAIRGLGEDRAKARRKVPWILILSGVAGGALIPAGDIALVIGGALLIMCVGGLIARYLHRRWGSSIGALAGVCWGMWTNAYLADFDSDPNKAFALVTTTGVITVIAGVVLVAANLSALRRMGRIAGPRSRAVIGTAAGYAAGFRFRSAMSMAMFGLVVYMIAAFAIWGGFGGGTDYREHSGGFDVFSTATVPVEEIELAGAERVVGLHVAFYDLGYRVGGSQEVRFPARLFGVGDGFVPNGFKLSATKSGLTDDQVWRMLASGDRYAILDRSTDPGNSVSGETLSLKTDRGIQRFEVLGVAEQSWMRGIFLSKRSFSRLYPSRSVDTSWLIAGRQGIAAGSLAASAERMYGPQGMDAKPIKQIFDEGADIQRTFVGIFQLLLKLGLVIGISGLGIGAIRTVLERRQAIGILRAMGFQSSMVGAWLMLESMIVATLGVAIGMFVGLVGTFWLVKEQIPSFTFSVDRAQIYSTLVIIYVAVLVFTAFPALRASRMRPSEAVRYVE